MADPYPRAYIYLFLLTCTMFIIFFISVVIKDRLKVRMEVSCVDLTDTSPWRQRFSETHLQLQPLLVASPVLGGKWRFLVARNVIFLSVCVYL